MEILLPLLLAGLILAIIISTILILRNIKKAGAKDQSSTVAVLEERINGFSADKNRLLEELNSLKNGNDVLNNDIKDRDIKISTLERDLAVSIKELESEEEQSKEKLKLLTEAREELTNQFKVLANSILDEKSKSFKEQNKSSLDEILNPLKVKLNEFQTKIQENYETEGKERHSLKNEVQKLMDMNNKLSQEAANLTNALKGDNKTQGNWGEMILEKILEGSGLRKGEEYTIQESHSRDDGTRVQPDVVIHLPEDRHMIIDSKVSLNAYDDYVNKDDDELRSDALKQHLSSIRAHIKGLASKEYQKLYDDKSPDFVIMFIPIESAFMLAISEDSKLWEEAWKNDILLVSPSTLLFVMRIVMQLWRQEHRSRNALDISQRGAALYEKLVGFVKDFEVVGNRIEQAGRSFDDAKGKLVTGRGNAIRQAEQLKELGITTNKQFPDDYVEDSKQEMIESNQLELE